jgi:transcriptional regulator with XRE-family HTH domain
VITTYIIGKVKRIKLRDQLSMSELSKRTGLARKSVKKWLNASGDGPSKYE